MLNFAKLVYTVIVKHTALWEKFVTSDANAGFFMQLIEISAVLGNYWIKVLYRRHFY